MAIPVLNHDIVGRAPLCHNDQGTISMLQEPARTELKTRQFTFNHELQYYGVHSTTWAPQPRPRTRHNLGATRRPTPNVTSLEETSSTNNHNPDLH
eukprot:4338401-Amphidinium_carterae.1